jgi:hypothetical protein
MSLIHLTPAQLRHAADLKEKIEALQSELGQLQDGANPVAATPVAAPAAPSTPGKRKISAAGLARIRAGQKARWAKAKTAEPAAEPLTRGRRKMSAAGRAKIAAAARARWAKFRAAKSGK